MQVRVDMATLVVALLILFFLFAFHYSWLP